MNIMIVEDEPLLLRVLVRAFLRAGHDVLGLASGFEAFEVLSSRDFDFVLMDVQLYGLNAPELLAKLEGAGRPVAKEKLAIMSAYPKHVVDSLFTGAAEDPQQNPTDFVFLQKPFEDVLKLVAMVEKLNSK